MQREASRPKVSLRITKDRRSYRLGNTGDAPAHDLALVPSDQDQVLWDDLGEGSLEPGQTCSFTFAAPANTPDNLVFTWSGQSEPVHVPVPR